MRLFFRHTLILVWKDVLIDLRRKDNLLSMLLFAILTLLVFQFALGEEPKMFLMALPGVIWIVFLLSGVLGLGKSYVQEMETGCMGGLLTAPVDRSVLFLGKMLANTLFLLFSQLLFIPLCLFLFEIEVRNWLELLDRKSTRLNSSHKPISYAVFCLKKKKICHSSLYSSHA